MMIPEPAESVVGFEAAQATAPADAPVLQLGAYEGPLDLLLALARAQRVDLTRISMVTLADAFIAMFERLCFGSSGLVAPWLLVPDDGVVNRAGFAGGWGV